MSEVIHLVHQRAGIPVVDLPEWLAGFANDEALGDAKSVILVVERPSGEVCCVAQSKGSMDGFRLVGVCSALVSRLVRGVGVGL